MWNHGGRSEQKGEASWQTQRPRPCVFLKTSGMRQWPQSWMAQSCFATAPTCWGPTCASPTSAVEIQAPSWSRSIQSVESPPRCSGSKAPAAISGPSSAAGSRRCTSIACSRSRRSTRASRKKMRWSPCIRSSRSQTTRPPPPSIHLCTAFCPFRTSIISIRTGASRSPHPPTARPRWKSSTRSSATNSPGCRGSAPASNSA